MKKCFLLLIGGLLLQACASFTTNLPGSIKDSVTDPTFQARNQPIRSLRIIAWTDDSFDDNEIRSLLTETSAKLREQTGIEFGSVKFAPISFQGCQAERDLMLAMEAASMKEQGGKSFDIGIAFSNGNDIAKAMGVSFFTIKHAFVEKHHLRFIVMRYPSVHVIMHEVLHCFILSHGEGECVMGSGDTYAPSCHYLMQDDWEEVQRNKWREFGPDVVTVKNPSGGYKLLKLRKFDWPKKEDAGKGDKVIYHPGKKMELPERN